MRFDGRFNLAIYNRDFRPGYHLIGVENMIARSKRTVIVVIDDDHPFSGELFHAFSTAFYRMTESDSLHGIVVIVGDDVAVPNLLQPQMEDPDIENLRTLLTARPTKPLRIGDRLFWQTLFYHMPHVRCNPVETDGVEANEANIPLIDVEDVGD
jgi:hypothetical protein